MSVGGCKENGLDEQAGGEQRSHLDQVEQDQQFGWKE